MREYDLMDLIFVTIGFIIGFIIAGMITILININHSSNTNLLCGVLSDNSISNSTVTMICKDSK